MAGAVRFAHPVFVPRIEEDAGNVHEFVTGTGVQYFWCDAGGLSYDRSLHVPPLMVRGHIAGVRAGSLEEWMGSMSDLLASFEKQGMGALERLEGDFSIALYHAAQDALYLYRSLTSTMSLYYVADGEDLLRWSTNPLSLLPARGSLLGEVDVALLPVLMTGGTYAPGKSCFKRLARLPTGSVATLRDSTLTVTRIADFRPQELGSLAIQDLGVTLRELLTASARRYFARDEAVGVLLSGGIDSSAVACVARDVGARPIAFHWSAEGYAPADEFRFAQDTAKLLSIKLSKVAGSKSISRGGDLLDVSWRFALPFTHPFLKWFEACADAAARQGVSTLTSGHLSDTLLGGSGLTDLRSLMDGLSPIEKIKYALAILGTSVPTRTLLRAIAGSPDERFSRLTAHKTVEYATHLTADAREAAYAEGSYRHAANLSTPLARAVHHSIKSQLETERETARDLAILRARRIRFLNPFADRQIIEFALGIEPSHRIRAYRAQMYDKIGLRAAFLGRLPPQVLSRTARPLWEGLGEVYCMNNRDVLAQLLGVDSYLGQLQILDNRAVLACLGRPDRFPHASSLLLVAAMVELWLVSLAAGRKN